MAQGRVRGGGAQPDAAPCPWAARGVWGLECSGRVGDERGCCAQHLGLRGSQEPGLAVTPLPRVSLRPPDLGLTAASHLVCLA